MDILILVLLALFSVSTCAEPVAEMAGVALPDWWAIPFLIAFVLLVALAEP